MLMVIRIKLHLHECEKRETQQPCDQPETRQDNSKLTEPPIQDSGYRTLIIASGYCCISLKQVEITSISIN